MIPWSFLSKCCSDMFLLRAVSGKVPRLVTVEAISGGGTVLCRVIPVLSPPLAPIPLSSTQVHRDRYVIERPGGIRRVERGVSVWIEQGMRLSLERPRWGSLADVLPIVGAVGAGW